MLSTRIAALFLIAVSAFADDDSQVRALLVRMNAAKPQTDRRLENFGYVESLVEKQDGNVKKQEKFEVSFFRDRVVRRLTEKDGVPLQGAALEKENRRVEKLVTQLDRGTAPKLDNRRLRLEDLIAAASFSNLHREQLQGREVIACEFHPRKGVKPANVSERFIQNLDGKLWLDEKALQTARTEFVLRGDFKVAGGLFFNMKAGTRFVEEDILYQNDVWLPRSREFTMNAKAMMGIRLNIVNTVLLGDYHRFEVSAKDSFGVVR